mmetsp:Transcript_9011/g.25326  ORF Transcript_9011/g.25326 Transcript_9011/m.25326 type:complete len:415 (+) Transcript_9011:91-1335(+)
MNDHRFALALIAAAVGACDGLTPEPDQQQAHAAPQVAQQTIIAQTPWGSTPATLATQWSVPGIPSQSYADLATVLTLHTIDTYMSHTIHATNDTYFAPIWDTCVLHYPFCAEMAAMGFCDDSSDHEVMMRTKCAPACRSCHLLSRETQCQYHHHRSARHLDALRPGDLNELFGWMERSSKLEQLYGSRTVHSKDPYVVSFDNFLTPDECERLIHHGHTLRKGFRSSTVRGHGDGRRDESFSAPRVADQNRTSSTNWINHEALADPVVAGIQRKLEDVTQHRFAENNFEYLQVLRYTEKQKYDHHLDYSPPHGEKAHGHRVLTVFLYLNDVEGGGETHFRDLTGSGGGGDGSAGIAITPKAGRMVIWPSVLDEAPNDKDRRTFHGSLPVTKGIKYGANAWIHQRDYRTPKRICKF